MEADPLIASRIHLQVYATNAVASLEALVAMSATVEGHSHTASSVLSGSATAVDAHRTYLPGAGIDADGVSTHWSQLVRISAPSSSDNCCIPLGMSTAIRFMQPLDLQCLHLYLR